jgi:predicted TIM-barrel fold metal-dependent hydrolase
MARDERLIGFASVDPHNPSAADELRVAVDRFGLRGLKLDPALQQFALNDRERAYPLYEACIELDIPVLVHCGLSWAPRGQAGRAHPLDLEMPVQELPELKLIIAHLGWPWTAEAMMLAIKHRNVHLDTSVLFSGTPADALRKAIDSTVGLATLNRSLRDQIVFGSNYPRVDPKRAAHAVRDLGLPPSLERRIFDTNARRLLKLEDA